MLKLLILKGVPPKDIRPNLWFIASGAKREMLNNSGYYEYILYNYPTEVDLPAERQIDLVNKLLN